MYLFAHPDRFDPGRENVAGHLGFGRGIHSCLGQNMARAEMRAVLGVLTSRVESFDLRAGQELRYGRNYVARGLLSLPLDVTHRQRS